MIKSNAESAIDSALSPESEPVPTQKAVIRNYQPAKLIDALLLMREVQVFLWTQGQGHCLQHPHSPHALPSLGRSLLDAVL